MTTPQHQIRENALELQDFVRGLHEWENDIKKKDRKLVKGNAGTDWVEKSGENCPPVRGVTKHSTTEAPELLKKPARQFSGEGIITEYQSILHADIYPAAQKPLSPMSRNKSPAAHIYKNYSQWDNFDVDAALSDCDLPEESLPQLAQAAQAPPHPKRLANKVLPAQTVRPLKRKPVEEKAIPNDANSWRQEGNCHFKIGDFQEASECYTKSIECKGTSLGYANRAMARLKMGEHKGAQEDCTEAINLDPMYIKAYQRRSASREALGDIQGAVEDLEMVVRLGPTSEAAKKNLLEGLNTLTRAEKLKPVKRRGKVPILFAKKESEKWMGPVDRQNNSIQEVNGAEGHISSVRSPGKKVLVQEGVASSRTPGEAVEGEQKGLGEATPLAGLQLIDCTSCSGDISGRQSRESPLQSTPRSGNKLPAKGPKTGAEFEASWKGLKEATVNEKSSYLSQVDPDDFQGIFKVGLSPPVMLGIVRSSLSELGKEGHSGFNAEHWIRILECLSKVPRFGMVVMCVGKREKLELGRLWDGVFDGLESGPAKSRLEKVRVSFGW